MAVKVSDVIIPPQVPYEHDYCFRLIRREVESSKYRIVNWKEKRDEEDLLSKTVC